MHAPVLVRSHPSPPASLGARLGLALRRIKQFLLGWQRRREMVVLVSADDRMLADIGVTRADVNDAFAGHLWDDPTMLLRARALERRLSRHRVTLGFPTPLADATPRSAPARERRKSYC